MAFMLTTMAEHQRMTVHDDPSLNQAQKITKRTWRSPEGPW